MTREDVYEYIKKKYNIKPDYLWEKYPKYAVMRHKNNKWFGIIMNIKKEKLGLQSKEEVDILDIKCYPEMIGNLRLEENFFPAYHMSKEHWVTVLLDKNVDAKKVEQLIDISYELQNKEEENGKEK